MKPSGNRLASIPVRITFGFSFMFYGIPKLFDLQTHGFIVGMLTQIGVPAPDLMTYVVETVESLGGLSLLLGAFVPLASVALIPVMLVGLFTVHLPQGFSYMHSSASPIAALLRQRRLHPDQGAGRQRPGGPRSTRGGVCGLSGTGQRRHEARQGAQG